MRKGTGILVVTLMLLMALMVTAAGAAAQPAPCPENQWTGAVDTNWDNLGNWSCGEVPSGVDAVAVIPVVVSGNYPVVPHPYTVTLLSLEVMENASFDLNGQGFEVASLINDGTLMDSRNLAIQSEVVPPTEFFRTNNYIGLILTRNVGGGLNNPGIVDVTIKGTQYCDSANSTIKRCFDINPAQTTNVSINAAFPFDTWELPGGMVCNQLQMYHWTGNDWLVAGSNAGNDCETIETPYFAISANNIDSFSPFVGAPGTPTAVSLVESAPKRRQIRYCYMVLQPSLP